MGQFKKEHQCGNGKFIFTKDCKCSCHKPKQSFIQTPKWEHDFDKRFTNKDWIEKEITIGEIKEFISNLLTEEHSWREIQKIEEEILLKEERLLKDDYITVKDDGRKTSEIMQECRNLFSISSYYSDEQLDRDFPPIISERRFKNVQEADFENKNKSADDCDKEGIKGISLRERLLMEIIYFKRTGEHLDIESITLCTGSRYSDGDVPVVSFRSDGRGLYVGWSRSVYRRDYLRTRSAV